jgi:hypothetical protein
MPQQPAPDLRRKHEEPGALFECLQIPFPRKQTKSEARYRAKILTNKTNF